MSYRVGGSVEFIFLSSKFISKSGPNEIVMCFRLVGLSLEKPVIYMVMIMVMSDMFITYIFIGCEFLNHTFEIFLGISFELTMYSIALVISINSIKILMKNFIRLI